MPMAAGVNQVQSRRASGSCQGRIGDDRGDALASPPHPNRADAVPEQSEAQLSCRQRHRRADVGVGIPAAGRARVAARECTQGRAKP